MPRNNGKARKAWRKRRANLKIVTPEERLVMAIFGSSNYGGVKPGTKDS